MRGTLNLFCGTTQTAPYRWAGHMAVSFLDTAGHCALVGLGVCACFDSVANTLRNTHMHTQMYTLTQCDRHSPICSQWSGFSLPELSNFSQMLQREEQIHVKEVRAYVPICMHLISCCVTGWNRRCSRTFHTLFIVDSNESTSTHVKTCVPPLQLLSLPLLYQSQLVCLIVPESLSPSLPSSHQLRDKFTTWKRILLEVMQEKCLEEAETAEKRQTDPITQTQIPAH